MNINQRRASAESAVGKLLTEASGYDLSELNLKSSFLELGFDSLFLVQLSQKIKSQLKVKVTFRQMIEEIPNIESLISYVADDLPDYLVNVTASPATQSAENASTNSSKTSAAMTSLNTPQVVGNAARVTAPTVCGDTARNAASTTRDLPSGGSESLKPPAELPLSMSVPQNQFPAGSMAADKEGLAQIISQQNQLMSLQLQLLSNASVDARAQPASTQITPAQTGFRGINSSSDQGESPHPEMQKVGVTPAAATKPQPSQEKSYERFGPYKPVRRAADGGLTEHQQESLDTFVAGFTKRTARSRKHAQSHRAHFADPRGVAGYRRIWKSLVYQICVDKSKGCKLWDIDGNEYIDIAMGFGLNLFGQSPDFVTNAIADQLNKGIQVGPQSSLAGEVAQLLCDFSRKDRATFCNTGSEAVMAAMRLARTVSGKSKVVFFNKDYHGNFDEVLIRSNLIGKHRLSQPAAPGVPQFLADNSIVLDYGTLEALEVIEAESDNIAAVLVEPVQSADLFSQPSEFLHQLRHITKERQIAMIMDEVITGFRAAPGGAQEWFDVWADMATYGKVLGGGMPIGALAGSAKYMDALDGGGNWKYEDDSDPEADMTFFAGTFVRHPLAMVAAHQVLMKIKESGPELQRQLTGKTTYLAESLNEFFEKEVYPFRIAHFASQFRFTFPPMVEYADLLYYQLLNRGVFTRGWGDNCFLSTAHDDKDVQRIIDAVKDSCNELRRGGFLPERHQIDQQSALPGTGSDALKKKRSRFPLTEAQLEIWITSQISDEASCSYNEPFTVRFHGDLNAECLCKAIQSVAERHSSLHTCFDKEGAYQHEQSQEPVEILREDISRLSGDEQQCIIDRTAQWFGSTPFDLSVAPLIRLKLVKLADDEHVLFFSAHHIVSDGWSTNLMLNEICEVYTASTEHRDVDLPEPADYADYVARESEDVEETCQAVDFWLEKYNDLPDPLDLPCDRPRPPVKSFTGSTLIHQFDTDVYQAIKKVAADNKATLFTLTFSALKVLLARLSGQNDIVVTIPTAGQVMAENPCLVGHCVNLLPIRSRMDLQDSFDTFMKSTQTAVLDAYDHQQCTLGTIVRELRMPRDPSRLPLVEVNFNLDRDGAGLRVPGLEIEVAQTVKTTSTFEMFFNLNETDNGLELYLDYASTLFDEATIRRWIGHYETLLGEIAKNTAAPIGKLPLLNAEQEDLIVRSWNTTFAEFPDIRVEELVEIQVQKTPDRVAVQFGKECLTFAELSQRADDLAARICDHGLVPDSSVGLCVERSLDMVVGVLAIFKAGGCFTPIDPEFPQQRIQSILDDSQIRLLITQPSLLGRFQDTSPTAICLEVGEFKTSSRRKPDRSILKPDQAAYVIYTSGSTGKPKGVQLTHRNLVNLLTSISRQPGFTDQDTMLAVTTMSFDIAIAELFLPLINGGKLVIADQQATGDGHRLLQLLQESKATFMQPTPATWKMLLQAGWNGSENLKIISTGEQLLNAPNATRAEYPIDSRFVDLFKQQVSNTPDLIAITCGGETLTYRELNARANRVANGLIRQGAKPDQLIGVKMPRGVDLVVALLGVQKSGATYVPLDPGYPEKRLALIVEDAGIEVVLEGIASFEDEDDQDPGLTSGPTDLAYVIFTSGSTGRPKGVQIEHRSLTNFLCSMSQRPGLSADDVLVAVTTVSFDIAALELYLPLIVGAQIVLATDEQTVDAHALSDLLTRSTATVMQATPATWQLLLDTGFRNPTLKALCGGEQLTREFAENLLPRCRELWNMYGPTETTIWSLVQRVQSGSGHVPIGSAIANTEVYLLDDRMQPVPTGVTGRLYLGGDGLARGYLNRNDLTAEKFLPHPFGDGAARIYDTGDTARWRPDGTIEFLGRADNQVKVRGFRIELGEIEQMLKQHPSIDQSVVVVREDLRGFNAADKSIVAYVVCNVSDLPISELRDFLRQALPAYMIPSAFVTLDKFPLTPNRKVDRNALPVPTIGRDQLTADDDAPRDSVERQIANVWKKTLGVETLGLDDDFFDVGGHSLLAARMIRDIEKLYGHRLPLVTLLQAPSVRQFAEIIKHENWQPAWQCLVPIQEGGSKPPLFLIHAAHGNVLLYRELAKALGPDQPVYGLQARGLDGKKPVHTKVEDMAADYVAEILKIQPSGPYHLGGYCLGGTIAYEVAQQLIADDGEVALLALFDTHSRWFQASIPTRLYTGIQQIAFHAGNVLMSGPKGMRAFLSEKVLQVNQRLGRRISVARSKLGYATGLRKEAPMALLERVNDRASEAYIPQYYAGKLTVFKPCKAYLGYEDSSLGWGNGLVDELEVIELPVFPAGMLIEPFVQELAARLQRWLDDSNTTVVVALPKNEVQPERQPDMVG